MSKGGRPPGSRNKTPNPIVSKEAKRKRHQRRLEDAVRLDEFLTAEAKQASAKNPDGDASFLYQGEQAKILGKQFDRVAKRLKRR
jgi:hypothetical protein